MRSFVAVSASNWLVGAKCFWSVTRRSTPSTFHRQNRCVGKYTSSVTGIILNILHIVQPCLTLLQDYCCMPQELPCWIVQERTMFLTQACMLKISYFKWLWYLSSQIWIVFGRIRVFNHQPDQIVTGLAEPTFLAGNWIKEPFSFICVWSTFKEKPSSTHLFFWPMHYNLFCSMNISERKELFCLVTLFHTTVTLCQKSKTILPSLLYFSTRNIPKNASLLNIDIKTWGFSVPFLSYWKLSLWGRHGNRHSHKMCQKFTFTC